VVNAGGCDNVWHDISSGAKRVEGLLNCL